MIFSLLVNSSGTRGANKMVKRALIIIVLQTHQTTQSITLEDLGSKGMLGRFGSNQQRATPYPQS